MLIADWVAIAIMLLFAVLGALVGFGKGLRFFTKGFIGFIISIIICYALGGFIIQLDFIANLLTSFRGLIEGKEGWFFSLLLTIRIDVIVYYVVLFIIVQIIRIIAVKLVVKLFSTKFVVMQVINKVLGILLFLGVLVLLTLIVFQVIYMIGGQTEESFLSFLEGSKINLDLFYKNNPLTEIVQLLFKIEIRIPAQG